MLWNHSQLKGVYILDGKVFELELKVALEGKSLLKYLNTNSQFVGSQSIKSVNKHPVPDAKIGYRMSKVKSDQVL